MSDYYQPTLLFRQNAIRRSPYSSPRSSESSLDLGQYQSKNPSWILNPNSSDTELLNKICSLDRLNIKSNYWKIPDNEMNLTSMAVKTNGDLGTLAISSGNQKSNLFIYELDMNNNYLTHHNTITLPNTHAMKWVPKNPHLLMTGNNKGYGHLVSVPSPENVEDSAEIMKRFNHRKHLRSINKDPSIFSHNSTIIEKMNFINSDQLVSIYDNNLFNWDLNDSTSSCKPKPTNITSINGLMNFDNNPTNSNILGICGKFGVSIFDLRDPKFSIPSAAIKECKKNKLGANVIKWSDNNENIFAASHLDGVVRLWDVRKQENYGNLRGHTGKQINSIEWCEGDLFTGGKDGNIIHWDLTNDIHNWNTDFMSCGLKEGLNSVNFNATKNREETIKQRQCGTVLPASNTNIISLQSVETSDDLKVLSIDGSSFFGLHSRIYDAVDIEYQNQTGNNKAYYSEEDIKLLLQSEGKNSDSTLVDDVESIRSLEITKPLSISKSLSRVADGNLNRAASGKLIEIIEPPKPIKAPFMNTTNNDSNDTLLDMPIEDSKLDIDFRFGMPPSREDFKKPDMLMETSMEASDCSFDDSPTSFNSNDTLDTIETEEIPEFTNNPLTGKPLKSHHKYQISDIQFDDDLNFNSTLMTSLAAI